MDDRRTEVLGTEAKIAWTKQRKREAEQQIVVAEAQAAAARAAVASAEPGSGPPPPASRFSKASATKSFIRSPFDGVVTEKAAEVGEIVAPISIGGSMARGSIVTIADWASLQAEVDVAEAQLGRVKPGQRAAITVDAIPGKVFPGKVRRILPRADRSKATVKVRVDFLARDEQAVLPEMGVRVRFLPDNAPPGVETGEVRDKIVVPKAAVQSGRRQFRVGRQRRRGPQAGRRGRGNSGERIEITSGVNAGDKVVVRGAERLTGETPPGAASGVTPA